MLPVRTLLTISVACAFFAFPCCNGDASSGRSIDGDHVYEDESQLPKSDRRQLQAKRNAEKLRKLQSKTGQLNVLVLLMRWKDHENRPLPSADLIRDMWNAEGKSQDWGPAGSIATWVKENSYEKLSIEATVIDWQTTDNTEAHYADGRSGRPVEDKGGVVDMENAFHPLLDNLDNENFDFSKFDLDTDGRLDLVLVLHSGYAAEEAEIACDDVERINRIQSFQSGADFNDLWQSSQPGSQRLGSFAISAAIRNQGCNHNIARMGVMTHEMMHSFGLIDTYDTNGSAGSGTVGGIAGFDIMANPGGQRNNKSRPGFLSAYSRYIMGWLEPTPIEADGTYELFPVETSNSAFIISDPYPEGEYLLIELRRPISFDEFLWDNGGIVIYHVDENVPGPTANGNRGYPGQQNEDTGEYWPGNGDHYRVAVLQADGLYQLEKGTSNGDINDFWLPGKMLKPGNGESVATSIGVYPSTDSYANGNIQVTGITLQAFADVAGSDGMSFTVTGMGSKPPNSNPVTTPAPNTPPSVETPTQPPSSAPGPNQPTLSPTPSSAAHVAKPGLIMDKFSIVILMALGMQAFCVM